MEQSKRDFPWEHTRGYNIDALEGGTPMKKAKHNYRVTVYLGKENYTKIKQVSDMLKISVAAMTRLMIDTGMQLAEIMEAEAIKKGGFGNGEQQPQI